MVPLRYVSTRGEAPVLEFGAVLLAGLARDGGLYLPETWPSLPKSAFAGLAGQGYADIAGAITAPYLGGGVDEPAMRAVLGDAYQGFRHKAVVPLVEIARNTWLLELFHGPTFAFKDLALQVLGRLMERALAQRGGRLTLIGATSGDTGSAAIEAFKGRAHIDIFILHPLGRVSEIQRRQMTTVDAPNVHNIAIEGTFDDAQALVKALFNDLPFRDRLNLAGVNSINWARVLAQIPYYAAAATALGGPERPVAFSVPTGNFGDILAGYAAKRMGLPVSRLVIATNENDILRRCVETGRYARGPVTATQSPSMDIQVSSNFERLLFDLYDRDASALRGLMTSLDQSGAFSLAKKPLERLRQEFDAFCVDEAETTDTIARIHAETGLIIDPHTAVGVAAGAKMTRDPAQPVICLATAHPAKFSEAVERAIGRAPALPEALAALKDKPERVSALANDLAAVKRFIAERSQAGASA
jgi:threonine synthase